jgi:hypothetical protein
VTKWVRNVALMGMKVIWNRLLIGKREERVYSEMYLKELYEDGF